VVTSAAVKNGRPTVYARTRQGGTRFDATSFLPFPPLCTVFEVAVVVNHLHLRDPISDETVSAFRSIVPRIVNGGASAAQVVQVDDTHIVLILEFTSAEDADRVASEIGGPWMREHIIPLLARGPERSVGEVIASATATG
jgi:hypothetical protein